MTSDSAIVPSDNARTILLLDDDTNTLLVLHAILERTAAQVLEDSNGPAVARKVKPLQPLMRLLYISGFSMSELQRRGLLSQTEMSPGSVEFLQKPFSSEAFLESVGRLLVSERTAPASYSRTSAGGCRL